MNTMKINILFQSDFNLFTLRKFADCRDVIVSTPRNQIQIIAGLYQY